MIENCLEKEHESKEGYEEANNDQKMRRNKIQKSEHEMMKNIRANNEKARLPDDGGVKAEQPVFMRRAPVIADGQEEEKCKGPLIMQPLRRQCNSQKLCLEITKGASFGGKVQKMRLSFNEPKHLMLNEHSRSDHQAIQEEDRNSQQKFMKVIDDIFDADKGREEGEDIEKCDEEGD